MKDKQGFVHRRHIILSESGKKTPKTRVCATMEYKCVYDTFFPDERMHDSNDDKFVSGEKKNLHRKFVKGGFLFYTLLTPSPTPKEKLKKNKKIR